MWNWVRFYLQAGLSVIPVKPRSKAPNLSSWTEYQTRQASPDEIGGWSKNGLFANIGIVCGFHNIIILDIENTATYERIFTKQERDDMLCRTWVVRSGGGGWHIYFQSDNLPKTLRLHNSVLEFDLQSSGAYCLAPPSVHPNSGARYEFQSQPGNSIARISNLERLLMERMDALGVDKKDRRRSWKNVESRTEGNRDDSLFRYGCHLRFCVGKSSEIILHEMKRANSTFRPPLHDYEVNKCWRNAMGYGGKDLGEKEIT
jgi:Bifunctional DNA primase/polymerase, N-terminal